MEVKMISKEIIRPSSPTPQHLRTYNLSLLDQLAPPLYIPIILFYSPTDDQNYSDHHNLKKSFSETLKYFYPLAGRITRDEFCIDCNDEGATYTEAIVVGEMSTLLTQEPDINQLQKLLPCNPHQLSQETTSQVILAAQVNRFDCGGIAISVCIWHAVADASAVASFVTSWASIVKTGNIINMDGVIFDCTSLFPPQDVRSFSLRNFVSEDLLSNIVVKRFAFDSSNLIDLRKEVGNGPCLDYPTRVEAVASLIWAAVMTLSKHENENESGQSMEEINVATISVGLRKRIVPTLPELSIGNIFQVAMANCSKNENFLDYNGLAGKIHKSIGKMNNEHVRKIHEGGAYFKFMKKKREEIVKNPKLMKVFGFSSWCRFPFYEADFGWGKPIWVGTALKLYNVAILMDTKDGQGIEAWVALPEQDMVKFEQNYGICAYASFKSST